MPVPEFILRNFYIKDSFITTNQGFEFQISNKIINTLVTQFSINDYPAGDIRIKIGSEKEFFASDINLDSPFEFSVGTIIKVTIKNDQKPPTVLRIKAETKEFGPFAFSIELAKKGFLHFTRSINSNKSHSSIHFTEQDWKRIHQNYQAWFHQELDRPLIKMESWGQQYIEFIGRETKINEMLERQDASLGEMHYHADSFPQFWPNFGAGVAAAWLGSEVKTELDTAWFFPLEKLPLKIELARNNYWWQKTLEATRKAVNRWGGKASVGITDIGGNLDILASLLGSEKLLTMLVDSPELVDQYTQQLTNYWLDCFSQLSKIILGKQKGTTCWGPAYFPGTGYYLQSDFSYMISSKMFERWALPDLEKCCNSMQYGFYHLDGKGQIRHLDMILGIKNLRGIQWIPGDGAPPPEDWLPLLARIRHAGKLCQVGTSRLGALKIIRELGGKGFLFEIQEFVNKEEADAFINKVNSLSSI